MTKKDSNKYPKDWNRSRVEAVIAHYDRQSEADAIAEADAAEVNSRFTLVPVPLELVREVESLIARRSRTGVSKARTGAPRRGTRRNAKATKAVRKSA